MLFCLFFEKKAIKTYIVKLFKKIILKNIFFENKKKLFFLFLFKKKHVSKNKFIK